jgi:hypothetical protein
MHLVKARIQRCDLVPKIIENLGSAFKLKALTCIIFNFFTSLEAPHICMGGSYGSKSVLKIFSLAFILTTFYENT